MKPPQLQISVSTVSRAPFSHTPTAKNSPAREDNTSQSTSRPLDHVLKKYLLGRHLHRRISFGWAWVGGALFQSAGRCIAVCSKMPNDKNPLSLIYLNRETMFIRQKKAPQRTRVHGDAFNSRLKTLTPNPGPPEWDPTMEVTAKKGPCQYVV